MNNKEFKLREAVSEMLLQFADGQQDMTRSDFQGHADIVAREIINLIRTEI